jgi:hypothetical protein
MLAIDEWIITVTASLKAEDLIESSLRAIIFARVWIKLCANLFDCQFASHETDQESWKDYNRLLSLSGLPTLRSGETIWRRSIVPKPPIETIRFTSESVADAMRGGSWFDFEELMSTWIDRSLMMLCCQFRIRRKCCSIYQRHRFPFMNLLLSGDARRNSRDRCIDRHSHKKFAKSGSEGRYTLLYN